MVPDRRNSYKPSAPLQVLGYISVFIYVSIGIYLLIRPGVIKGYSPTVQTVLGAVLLLYGIFRLYIIIQRNRWLKKQRHDNEQE